MTPESQGISIARLEGRMDAQDAMFRTLREQIATKSKTDADALQLAVAAVETARLAAAAAVETARITALHEQRGVNARLYAALGGAGAVGGGIPYFLNWLMHRGTP